MRTIAKKNWLQMQVVLKQLGDESIPGYRHSLWRKAQDWQKHKGAFSNMSVARWQGQNLTLWTLSERQACIKSRVLLLSVNKCFNPSSFQLERKLKQNHRLGRALRDDPDKLSFHSWRNWTGPRKWSDLSKVTYRVGLWAIWNLNL